ncbi:hypothetical protein NtRootA1_41750 [Arthrobacter sp. NtRootA1]|nr:hypothetical protein NtRootA1_41750 [Arthrobacter sp. NtRootA1]
MLQVAASQVSCVLIIVSGSEEDVGTSREKPEVVVGNLIEIDDAIVLLLGTRVAGARPGEIQGITRLEKLVFLLERETSSKSWLSQDAGFEPYNFGPFSQKVYQAVDMLAAAQLIEDSSSPSPDVTDIWEQREGIGLDTGSAGQSNDPYRTRDFRLTERGWKYFEALTRELPRGAVAELQQFKRQFGFLPLRQLIRYVYTRYQEYTTKSVIRDEILGPNT